MNLQDVLLVASSSVNTPIKRVLLLQTNDLEVVHLSRVIRSFVVREKKKQACLSSATSCWNQYDMT